MVSAEQHSFPGKSCVLRCGMNEFGELKRSLSSVAAQLIHLARRGFHV